MLFSFSILIVILMFGTLVALMVGLIAMARGGSFNAKNSNKLMRLRVGIQFFAITLLGLLFLFTSE